MTIEIDSNDINKEKILGIISHELTHIKEYYEVQKKSIELKIKITPTHIDIKEINKKIKSYKTFEELYQLIYLSLDDEMNSRISQIYHYLYSFNIKDIDLLFDKVKSHKNWEYVVMLDNFDSKKFVNYNIKKISLECFLKITNELIDKFKDKNLNKRTKMLSFINKYVSNEKNLYEFYECWSKYFNLKSKKHIEKIKYIISEVIEDLNGNRPYNENYRNSLNDPLLVLIK